MTSGAGNSGRKRRSRLPVLRWLLRRSERRKARHQTRVDRGFWDLVHRHDWLQYDPPEEG